MARTLWMLAMVGMLSGLAWPAGSSDWGFLLGLRRDGRGSIGHHGRFLVPAPDHYRTLWIRRVNGVVQASELPGLWTPHGGSFRHVDVIRQSVVLWSEDRIVVSPAAKAAPWPTPAPGRKRTAGYLSQRITWLGRDYLSTWTESAGQLFDGSPPWLENHLSTSPLSRPETPCRLGDKLGDRAVAEVSRTAADYRMDHPWVAGFPDTADWGFVRREGTWILSSQVGGHDGAFAVFDVPVCPRRVVGYDGLDPAWQEVSDSQRSALDAFTAPARQVLAVVLPGVVEGYRVSDIMRWSDPQWAVALEGREFPVMEQWTDDVDQWERTLGAAGRALEVRRHF
ncbi:MAG TPA: hypothetical protein VGO93_02895 [Candidatus Xenobia bacterium]